MKIIILLLFILCIIFFKHKDNFSNISEYNSIFLNPIEDMGILRKINKNRNFYAIKNEYNFNEFKTILNKIVSQTNLNNYTFVNKSVSNIPNKITDLLLLKINYYSKVSGYDDKRLNIRQFDINFIQPLQLSFNKQKNTNKYEFNIKIYRENKTHFFSLYVVVYHDLNSGMCLFNQIDIIGILPEQFLNNLHNKTDKYSKLVTDNKILFEYTSPPSKIDTNYTCFPKNSRTRNDCISPDKNGVIGVWDSPCTQNSDCPFYKKNTNYSNNRGGCLSNGFCELPLGLDHLGYRYYYNKPFCHNCYKTNCDQLDCNRCCDANNDLAYANDFAERSSYKIGLSKKGLKVNGLVRL